MARLISEKMFTRHRILMDSDIEQAYSDLAIEEGNHKLKNTAGAYIV